MHNFQPLLAVLSSKSLMVDTIPAEDASAVFWRFWRIAVLAVKLDCAGLDSDELDSAKDGDA